MNRKTLIKTSAVAATLALATAGLAACGGGNGGGGGGGENNADGGNSGAMTTITMLTLGDRPTNGRLEAMLDDLNVILAEEANAKLEMYYVEWADWQTQYNVALLANDGSVDLIATATDWLFAWENAQRGAFLPLSEEMLQENAPKTYAQVDSEGNWEVTKWNDQIWFIPEDNFTQYTNHGFFYRGDWATEAGFANGEITKFEDFTTYFQWVKENKPEAYPWDVAGSNAAVLDGYIAGHADFQIVGPYAGNYGAFSTTLSDPTTITSWLMEGDTLLQAAELAKEWNELGVWREDALNYDGDTRELFFAGLSGADQHHTQTYIGSIWHNMTVKQPDSDPKFFHWGTENDNFSRDIRTHGAMAVSAASKNPEKALQVYDIIRNNEEAYALMNFGIEGTDYILNDEGKLDYPEGYDPSTDSLGSNFWWGRMDEYHPDSVNDAPNKWEIYAAFDEVANIWPYETFIYDKTEIESQLAAIGGVLSVYIPQLQYGKFDDPAAEIDKMRAELTAAGWNDARDVLQGQLDEWYAAQG